VQFFVVQVSCRIVTVRDVTVQDLRLLSDSKKKSATISKFAILLSSYFYYMYSANRFSKQIVKGIDLHWNLPQTIINNRTQLQNSHAEIVAGKS